MRKVSISKSEVSLGRHIVPNVFAFLAGDSPAQDALLNGQTVETTYFRFTPHDFVRSLGPLNSLEGAGPELMMATSSAPPAPIGQLLLFRDGNGTIPDLLSVSLRERTRDANTTPPNVHPNLQGQVVSLDVTGSDWKPPALIPESRLWRYPDWSSHSCSCHRFRGRRILTDLLHWRVRN